MEVAVIQHTTTVTTTTPDAVTYTRTLTGVVAGHVLVIAHAGIGTGATVTRITGGGATWTKIKQKSNTSGGGTSEIDAELWLGKGGTGGSITVTVHLSKADYAQAILYELSGTTGTLTGSAVTYTSSTSKVQTITAVPGITPGTPGTLALYVVANETNGFGTGTTTGPSGWTTTKFNTYTSNNFSAASYHGETSTTAYDPTWKATGTGYTCAVGCVFKPSTKTPITLAGSSVSTSSASGTLTVVTRTTHLAGSSSSSSSVGAATLTIGEVTYTRVAGFPIANELANQRPETSITQSFTTGALDDIVIVLVHNGVYDSGTGSYTRIAYATSLSDTATAVATWTRVAEGQDKAYPSTPAGQCYELWMGRVVKASTTTTATATFASPGVTDLFIYIDQCSSSLGSNAKWASSTSNFVVFDGNATTVEFPDLTSGAGGIYWGYSYGSITDTGDMSPGSTPGFSYSVTPTFGNMITYNGALAADTAYQPTCTQAYSGHGWYDSIGAIFVATRKTPISLAGGSSSASSATGSLTVPISLAGSATSISSLTGALRVPVSLAGACASSSSASGALTVGVELSGSCTSGSSATGSLTVPLGLAGGSSSSSSASGALVVGCTLAGSSVSTSSASGTLTVTEPATLAGSSSSTSTLRGSLTVGVALAGSSLSTSTATGALRVPVSLAGGMVSTSAAAGSLKVPMTLQGSSISASSLTGSLVVSQGPILLAGSSTSTSRASGSLTVIGPTLAYVFVAAKRPLIFVAGERHLSLEAP